MDKEISSAELTGLIRASLRKLLSLVEQTEVVDLIFIQKYREL